MEETIETSPTGGSKGQKLERHDLIPTGPLRSLAKQYGRGIAKYDERNWERGYKWSLSYAAAMRHLTAFWDGENWDTDPMWADDPPHHLDAAMFHIMALREFFSKRPEYDDRSVVRNRRGSEGVGEVTEGLERFGALPRNQATGGRGLRERYAEAEQVPTEGRDSTVQVGRWSLP